VKARFFLALLVACFLGALGGALICESLQCRKRIAQFCGRKWTSEVALRYRARREKISREQINQTYERLRSQMADAKTWGLALMKNGLCPLLLRYRIADNLRGQKWLDRQIATASSVSEAGCRQYFEGNGSAFVQPERFRVAHLFLAAPPETVTEVVETKRRIAEELAKRLQTGEKLADLAVAFSEDEATKKRGGDLNYFSKTRMPADFIGGIEKLRVGETGSVFQTRLGFHIAKLLERKESRLMTFEEARSEITTKLANAQRREATRQLISDLERGKE
jgi:PPIC-type PPIASE domain